MRKEEIRRAASIVAGEAEKYCRSVLQDLKQDAPRTTPDNMKIEWGKSEHEGPVLNLLYERVENKGEMNYQDFFEGLIVTYLRHVKGIEVPGYPKLDEEYLETLGWWSGTGRKKGSHNPSGEIWVSFLPTAVMRDMASKLEQNGLEQVEMFPVKYSKSNVYSGVISEFNDNVFHETVAHELTHYFLTQKTRIGDVQKEVNDDSNVLAMDSKEFAEFVMAMEGKGKEMSRQAEAASHNSGIIGIEEVFSHFIGYQYLDNPSLTVSSAYDRSEYIQWGLKIVYQKAEEENVSKPVDWARIKAGEIFEDIAQKGQLRKGGGKRDVFTYFIKHMLLEKERETIKKFRQINENHVSKAYSDLEKVLRDIEEKEHSLKNTQAFRDLKKFEKNMDWNYPEEIEDEILHQALEDAVGNYGLEKLYQRIENDLKKEARNLMKIIQTLGKLENELGNQESHRELENVINEFKQVEDEIENII